MKSSAPKIKTIAKIALFITSYTPLFAIMIARQLFLYKDYLHWGGLSSKSLSVFAVHFGAATLLLATTTVGLIGVWAFLSSMKRDSTTNGFLGKITSVDNKNSEAISYLFTYLIPFAFQDLSKLEDVASICILLFVSYKIYTNSNLLLINPLLSFWYSIYQVTFEHGGNATTATLLIPINDLDEGCRIKLHKVGHKLFYSHSTREEM